MTTRDEDAKSSLAKFEEESSEPVTLALCQNGEAGQGAPLTPIEGWRNPPDATPSIPKFLFLGICVLFETVRGVGDNGVDGMRRAPIHPGKGISEVEGVLRSARSILDQSVAALSYGRLHAAPSDEALRL
jgi:hypothetical protein